MTTRSERLVMQQQAALLAQLEAEERAGWPDLPWPPVSAAQRASDDRIRRLELLLQHVYNVMLGDERRHRELLAANASDMWANTGMPKKAA